METTFTHLFNVDEEERDALVADAEALVNSMRVRGIGAEASAEGQDDVAVSTVIRMLA